MGGVDDTVLFIHLLCTYPLLDWLFFRGYYTFFFSHTGNRTQSCCVEDNNVNHYTI